MRVRNRRLKFEPFEQRKVFATDMAPELLPPPGFGGYETQEAMEADGVRAAEVRIQFDPLTVRPDMNSLRAGDAWNGKASVVANVDEVAGTLVAFVFATRPIAGQGNLLELEFKSTNSDSSQGGSSGIGIDTVRLNEGQIEIPYELTVLASPGRQGGDAEQGDIPTDSTSVEWSHEDAPHAPGLFHDEMGIQSLGVRDHEFELPGFEVNDFESGTDDQNADDTARGAMPETGQSGGEFVRNHLHDMRISSVFIGPVRPDFLD